MFKPIQKMFQQMFKDDIQSWKPVQSSLPSWRQVAHRINSGGSIPAMEPGQNETYAIEACHSDGDVTSVPLASDA